MFGRLNAIAFDNGISVQWSLTKLMRCLENLDLSLVYLVPKTNCRNYLTHYFNAADSRLKKIDKRRLIMNIPRSVAASKKLSYKFREFTIFQQQIVRRQAQMTQGNVTKSSYIIAAIFGFTSMLLFFIELIALLLLVEHCFGYTTSSLVGNQISSLVNSIQIINCHWTIAGSIITLYLFILTRKAKKRMERVEIIIPETHAAV